MKLFISYSRDDAGDFAKHIHRYLRDKGHAVFIDVNSIRIGDPWAGSIEKNISDCDLFVIILTPDSITSPHVEREVLQAQKQNKIIVPCINEDVEYSEIKWGLEKVQGLEFSDEYQLKRKLYSKIKNYTNKENEKPSSILQQNTIQDTNIFEDVNTLNETNRDKVLLNLKDADIKNVTGLKITTESSNKYSEALKQFSDNISDLFNKYNVSVDNRKKVEYSRKQLINDMESLPSSLSVEYMPEREKNNIQIQIKNLIQNIIKVVPPSVQIFSQIFTVFSPFYDIFDISADIKTISPIVEDEIQRYKEKAIKEWTKKGLKLSVERRDDEALVYFNKALEVNPMDFTGLLGKGLVLNDLGKHQEAIEYLDKSLAIHPNFTLAQDGKKLALEHLSKEKSSSYYDTTSKGTMPKDWKLFSYSDYEDIDTLNRKGTDLYNLGKYQEAIEYYDKALRVDQNYVSALYGKGVALYYLKKYQDAIECYNLTLLIDPNHIDAWYYKGNSLRNQRKYHEALECYNMVLIVNPNNIESLNTKGIILYDQRRYEEAIKCYDTVLSIDPSNSTAHYNKKLAVGQLSEEKTLPKKKGFFGFRK